MDKTVFNNYVVKYFSNLWNYSFAIGFQLNHSSMSSVFRWYWRTNGNIFNLKKIWNTETINNSTNWIRIECCSHATTGHVRKHTYFLFLSTDETLPTIIGGISFFPHLQILKNIGCNACRWLYLVCYYK